MKKRFMAALSVIIVIMFWIGDFRIFADSKNPEFYILANEPLVETFKNAYPEVEEFYDSDTKLVFVATAEYSKPEKYLVKVQLQNPNGIKIVDEQRELNPKYSKNKPWIYYVLSLDKEVKAKLFAGMVTARLYIDGRPYGAKSLKYNPENIINKNFNQIVILPFYCTGDRVWDYKLKEDIINTFADAIHCEVKRITPSVIPPDLSKQKSMGLNIKKCFKDPDCLKNLRDIYGEGIFITGDVAVPSYYFRSSYSRVVLEVMLVNSKTWEMKKFAHTFEPSTMYAPEAMKILIQKVLYQQGLWAYVRGML
jgi:hypothetical protein